MANYKNQETAERRFNNLKSNSLVRASEVEGMVGILPVQVRFLVKIRNDGDGGIFTQKSNYVFFLFENADVPAVAANWIDYEDFFIASIAGDDEFMETIKLRNGSSTR